MKIHYFQRYHKGEDVATANTMLLLSRLYSYSSGKFFQFLKEQYFGDVVFEPELAFVLQDKGKKSVPDATITQPSFKLVVETKLTDWFYKEQLINHLEKFKNEEYKVLITLSSERMNEAKKKEVDEKISAYNSEHQTHIIHVNTTFELLAQGVQDVITEHDYEMQEVLDDFVDYCHNDKLIVISDAWKKMRMQLAGNTFDFNVAENVYYDNMERGFSAHDYLGLYKQKSIRALGKIEAIITAVRDNGELVYNAERGEITEERKQTIAKAIEDGKKYEYYLDAHRYFFVEKFYETDFPKTTPRAPMGTRMFELTKILKKDELPETEKIAELLRNESWS
ncbi:MAG: hypothetical protein E7285_00885 [Lachnospiraceae bacterium]|nr:hypothetical protein [Lachnospiraceae bacterium]